MADEPKRRLTAQQIFEEVAQSAREELQRSTGALAFSGLAGGVTMGLTALGVALVRTYLGDSSPAKLVSYAMYPLGFVAVILGRSQLFTENTLYPVVLVLDERRHVRDTLRLWLTVFSANVLGAALFGLFASKSGGLTDEVVRAVIDLGKVAAERPRLSLFASAIFGGWLIALVAWLVTAAQGTMGQLTATWAIAFVVGAGHFGHCIAGSAEIWAAVFDGTVGLGTYGSWLAATAVGNIVGGVCVVSLLNYAQVSGAESK